MQHLNFKQRWKLPHYFDAKEIQTGKVEFDQAACTGCGRCARCCPVGSIVVPKGLERGLETTRVLAAGPDLFLCFACSNCVTVCPEGAITLARRYTARFYFNRLFRTAELTPPRKY